MVLNRPVSLYEEHTGLVWGVTLVFLLLVGLVTGLALNIARRRAAERELVASRERLQLVLDGAELGLWDWDVPTGRVTFNRRWAEMLGFRLDELEPSVAAGNGREALAVFEEEGNGIGCVLLDLTMPEMDGEECFQALKKRSPDVKVLLSSGYNEEEATRQFVGLGIAGFIQKPYTLANLEQGLRAALGNAGSG